MKIREFLYVIVLCYFFLFGCSSSDNGSENLMLPKEAQEENEEVEGGQEIGAYFTAEIGCIAPRGNMGSWMILHNEDGALLDFKPYEFGDILVFEAPENEQPDVFTVTTLAVNNFQEVTWQRIESKTETAKGTKLGLTCDIKEEQDPNPVIGSFRITVNNVPTGSHIATFIATNGQSQGNELVSSTNGSFINYTSTLDVLKNKTDYLIVIYDGQGGLKQLLIENYETANNMVIDYAQFSTFDSYINIELPSYQKLGTLLETDEKEGDLQYLISAISSSDGFQKNLKLGFLDRFQTYNTIFSIKLNDSYEYKYLNYDAEPEAIIIPEQPSFSVLDESINNFRYTTDLVDYTEKKSSWSYENDEIENRYKTTWDIVSTKNYLPVIGNLPPELIEKYPNLNIQNLGYSNTEFRVNEKEKISLTHVE